MPISYNTVFFASAVGALPVALWLWLAFRADSRKKMGRDFLLNIFFWGVFSALIASVLEIALRKFQDSSLFPAIETSIFWPAFIVAFCVAVIEECAKAFGIWRAFSSKKVTSLRGGIILGILVGLAFGVTENGVYFTLAIKDNPISSLTVIIALRFLISTTAHIMYSGLMAAYLGDFFLGKRRSSLVNAFLIPIAIHLVFDLFLSISLGWMVSFVVIAGGYGLWRKYNKSYN